MTRNVFSAEVDCAPLTVLRALRWCTTGCAVQRSVLSRRLVCLSVLSLLPTSRLGNCAWEYHDFLGTELQSYGVSAYDTDRQ